jgi:transposase-like protein
MRNAISAARRVGIRAGYYERSLQTKAGEVRLRVPKLRQQMSETAIIERYRRRESSVEEALIEMYLPGYRCVGSRTSRRHCGARECRLRWCRT